eukprot:2795422-Prymnesium_polylepis.1
MSGVVQFGSNELLAPCSSTSYRHERRRAVRCTCAEGRACGRAAGGPGGGAHPVAVAAERLGALPALRGGQVDHARVGGCVRARPPALAARGVEHGAAAQH